MTALDDIVAKFRKQSPNIAAAFEEVQRVADRDRQVSVGSDVKQEQTVAALEARVAVLEQPAPPPPVPAPVPPPPIPLPSSAFFGLVVRAAVPVDIDVAKKLGVRTVRVEFAASAAASALDAWIARCDAAGIRLQPLAGFAGHAVTTAEAQNLRSWALRHPGKFAAIEFGNETSFSYQAGVSVMSYADWASNYARKAKEAAVALRGTAVGLLIQNDDADGWPWIESMKAAIPDLGTYAAGWTIHPYGPSGHAKLQRAIDKARAAGWSDTIPFHCTEWGLSTDDGRTLSNNYGFPVNQTFVQAAATLKSEMTWYRAQPRVKQLLYYMSVDGAAPGASTDREAYFGLYRTTGADKGALTVEAKAQAAL